MNLKLGVGKSDFADLRQSGNYYVDKTEIIYELVNDTDNEVSLFTRPRRFGKTLMMSMFENFFQIKKDSRSYFEGLSIMQHQEFCEKWMNQYPVLFVSLKDVEAESYESALKMLEACVADLCKNFMELEESPKVNAADKEIFQRLMYARAEEHEIKHAFKLLMRMLHAVYGKKVILLIDEYDVPLAKASEKNTSENLYYDKMLDIVKGMMSTALKDNEYLQFAIVTGCLRIAKESIFTGTNNFVSYSVLDDEFSGYFGFSESEVLEMLHLIGREEKAALMKEWYNGYVFGNSDVYCPWDVINYLSDLKKSADAKPKNYWKNTSHNGILYTFVKRKDFDVRDKFETLLNNGTIIQTVSDELTYDTLHASEENLWSVLLLTGYITKGKEEVEGTISLRIPNREIATIFEETVVRFFKDTVSDDLIRTLLLHLWNAEVEEGSKLLSELLWDTISYHDYHEDYYHAFLTGLFVGRGYSVESNKERGLGRPDILVKDRKNRRAIVIEAKKSKKREDMKRHCEDAIEQIKNIKYLDGLEGYEEVLAYGVAFYQKEARIALYKS